MSLTSSSAWTRPGRPSRIGNSFLLPVGNGFIADSSSILLPIERESAIKLLSGSTGWPGPGSVEPEKGLTVYPG